MIFKKEDENYIYNVIGKNVKKYRKIKGLTQVELAEKIDYSVSFVSSIESKKHQTFSLGALWRISLILGIDMYKLCIDEEADNKKESKFTKYKCNNCNYETEIPSEMIDIFVNTNKIYSGNYTKPNFKCKICENGKLYSKD